MGACDPFLFGRDKDKTIEDIKEIALKYAERCDYLNRQLGTSSHEYQSCLAEIREKTN